MQFRLAAKQGYVPAQYSLGVMLANGLWDCSQQGLIKRAKQ
ncbi:hypothetical protein [Legionella antarctica]|nr:hypothetical protein [Legionella antarctica]